MSKDFEEERFKQVIHYTVSKICENIQHEQKDEIVFTKQTIATIAEITYRQSQIIANDLECFAQHAKRKRITVDDVLLCARRSPSLHQHLEEFKQKLASSSNAK
ncbi:centromere protein S-like [Styela clava]